MSSFSTPTAFDSPPDVHQCSTSTDSAACAETAPISPVAASAAMIARTFILYLLRTPEQDTIVPRFLAMGNGGWSNRTTLDRPDLAPTDTAERTPGRKALSGNG